MELKDLMKNTAEHRVGYIPNTIYPTSLKPKDMGCYRKLRVVPAKISAYFHRTKIKNVYKATMAKKEIDNSYFVQCLDDTMFEIIY